MSRLKIFKAISLSILGTAAFVLLFYSIRHFVEGGKTPVLKGVNVSQSASFMGFYIMGICFMIGFLVVIGLMLFIILYKRKSLKHQGIDNGKA